jgi:hypothetical protein
MPDERKGDDLAAEDIDAAQAVLLGLQNARAKATEELSARRARLFAEDSGLVDINYSQTENGSSHATQVVRVAMFFGYNGSGYHVRPSCGITELESLAFQQALTQRIFSPCAVLCRECK